MTLEAFVCPPLFFARRRHWMSFVLNAVIYLWSALMVLAGLRAVIGPAPGGVGLLVGAALVWLLCLAHVLDTRRRERAKARVTLELGVRLGKGVKVAIFIGSFIGTMVALEAAYTSIGSPAGMPPFALFPVVVVTRSTGGDVEARIVFYKDLEPFCRTHPGTTYLVPREEAGRLRGQLKDGSFTVTQLPNGRQAFKVWKWVHSEAHVTGWYEASEKELFPTHWRLFHDMMKVIFFFPALVVSVVTTLIAGKLLPWIGRAARLIAHR